MASNPHDWMANVEKKKETIAMRNAAKWRESGYGDWKAHDPEREKELPIGGVAPQRSGNKINKGSKPVILPPKPKVGF